MTAAEWLARARAVTDGVTPGPWRVGSEGSEGSRINPDTGDKREDTHYIASANGRTQPQDGRNAAFIAASRVLLPAAVAAIEAVLALHERVTRWGNEDYSISQDGYDDAEPEDRASLSAFDVCAECFRIEQTSDQHDGYECTHAVLDGLWPCPTFRAIAAHLDQS